MDAGILGQQHARLDAASPATTGRSYRIRGGRPLRGTLAVGGSKNAVAKQLVASILTDEPCLIANVPHSGEIDSTLAMLGELGARWRWTDGQTLLIHTPRVIDSAVSRLHARYSRLPILLLVALLHRAGSARAPEVGGCELGPRPVDFHLQALAAMGADVARNADGYVATARRLRGVTLRLPFPSVGATESALLAASLADGETTIHNAAVEPEVLDTILMLEKMGANIQLDVDRTMRVVGVRRLHGAYHATMPDRTEVVSYAAAAIATRGAVTISNACQSDLAAFVAPWRELGADFAADSNGLKFFRLREKLAPIHVETGPHPAFMTDWQPLLAVLAMQSAGESTFHETVFENRFGYATELRRLGGNIEVNTLCPADSPCRFQGRNFPHACRVRPGQLQPGTMRATDLRAGFACLVAALATDGVCHIENVEVIERGYDGVIEKLRALGADIEAAGSSR